VPVPVPKPIIDALVSVEVTSSAGGPSGFQLQFNLSGDSPLNALMLLAGEVGPIVRVVIIATVGGIPHVLSDGVITNVQVSPNVQTGQTTVTLTGDDLTAALNLMKFTGLPYPAMPPEARVALILAKYAVFGLIPLVIPTLFPDVPIPTNQIPSHAGTDLEYINQLAERAGYVFYIQPGPIPLTNVAYWGPEIRVGLVQPALNVNMDMFTNVETLNFQFRNDGGTLYYINIQEPFTKATIPIPIPDISLLNPPLGLVPPLPVRVEPLPDTAHLNPIQAALRGLSATSRASEVVKGRGTLDILRYGHVLKSRQLVGVRGAGMAFDGLYYVKSVTHNIKRGEYKTSFELTRNGLISTVPVVPV
jgi:hypothetical protein